MREKRKDEGAVNEQFDCGKSRRPKERRDNSGLGGYVARGNFETSGEGLDVVPAFNLTGRYFGSRCACSPHPLPFQSVHYTH